MQCIHKAAVLSCHVYQRPRVYHYKNPNSKHIQQDNMIAYVTPCWSTQTAYITFRGACSTGDLIDGASALITRDHDVMHTTYMKRYLSMHQNIEKAIKGIKKDGRISNLVFTGHSMGGSLAISGSLIHTLLQNENYDSIYCITFGSPKSVHKDYADVIDHMCVENIFDPVPYIPLHPDLITLPNKMLFKEPYLNPYKSHSIVTYRRYIEGLLISEEHEFNFIDY